ADRGLLAVQVWTCGSGFDVWFRFRGDVLVVVLVVVLVGPPAGGGAVRDAGAARGCWWPKGGAHLDPDARTKTRAGPTSGPTRAWWVGQDPLAGQDGGAPGPLGEGAVEAVDGG